MPWSTGCFTTAGGSSLASPPLGLADEHDEDGSAPPPPPRAVLSLDAAVAARAPIDLLGVFDEGARMRQRMKTVQLVHAVQVPVDQSKRVEAKGQKKGVVMFAASLNKKDEIYKLKQRRF